MIQLVSSSQEGAVMGDLVQVMEGGTLSVQATGTRQQTEKMEKYFLLFGSLKLISYQSCD